MSALLPQFGAEARADQLVAHPVDLPAVAGQRRARSSSRSASSGSRCGPTLSSRPRSAPPRAGSPPPTTSARAASTLIGRLVEYSTSRPPVNSTPKFRPRAAIPAPPATSARPETASQIRRRPIRSGLRGVPASSGPARWRRARSAPAAAPRRPIARLGQHPGDHQRGDHRGEHADGQGDAEAAHRARGEEEQQPRRRAAWSCWSRRSPTRRCGTRSSARHGARARRRTPPGPARTPARWRRSAMPIASTNPARPGRVSVAPSATSAA